MKRTIKFRGRDMNGRLVYGLLTKKKLRHSGDIVWAIAMGDCSQSETVPVNPSSIVQMVGYDERGLEVYEGDAVEDADCEIITAEMSDIPIIKACRLLG